MAGVLLLAAIAGLLVGLYRGWSSRPRPHVVVYLLDAARADYFGCYGQKSRTTPNMDALAAGGVRFARHYGNSFFTRASVSQLFTSRYQAFPILRFVEEEKYGWWVRDESLPPDVAFLPEVLASAGYRTVMVSAHPFVTRDSELGRRFEEVHELRPEEGPFARAEAVFAEAERVAIAHGRSHPDRPLFLYIHLMDTHTPHYPPPPFDRFYEGIAASLPDGDRLSRIPAVASNRYESLPEDGVAILRAAAKGSFAYVDEHLGRFSRKLPALLAGRILQTITADHGDAYGEDGYVGHTNPTFGMEELHHIPWILHGPRVVPAGEVVTGWTSMIDVMPTLLSVARVPLPAEAVVDGRSRLPPSGSDGGVVLVHRLRSRSSVLGYRTAGRTYIVDGDDIHERVDGGSFHRTGQMPERESSLPRAFVAAIRELRRRDERRQYVVKGPQLLVPADEWRMGCRGAACGGWNVSDSWRTSLESLDCDSRTASCPPLTVSFDLPRGAYRATAVLDVGPFSGAARRARVEIGLLGQPSPRHVRAGFAGSLDVGRTQHSGGTLTIEVRVRDGATLMWRRLEFQHLEGESAFQASRPETDPAVMERLKALGYVR